MSKKKKGQKEKEKMILPRPEVHREQCFCGMCEVDGQKCSKVYSDDNIGDVCIAYRDPGFWNKKGRCPLNSLNEMLEAPKGGSKKINPLKASRRKFRR